MYNKTFSLFACFKNGIFLYLSKKGQKQNRRSPRRKKVKEIMRKINFFRNNNSRGTEERETKESFFKKE